VRKSENILQFIAPRFIVLRFSLKGTTQKQTYISFNSEMFLENFKKWFFWREKNTLSDMTGNRGGKGVRYPLSRRGRGGTSPRNTTLANIPLGGPETKEAVA